MARGPGRLRVTTGHHVYTLSLCPEDTQLPAGLGTEVAVVWGQQDPGLGYRPQHTSQEGLGAEPPTAGLGRTAPGRPQPQARGRLCGARAPGTVGENTRLRTLRGKTRSLFSGVELGGRARHHPALLCLPRDAGGQAPQGGAGAGQPLGEASLARGSLPQGKTTPRSAFWETPPFLRGKRMVSKASTAGQRHLGHPAEFGAQGGCGLSHRVPIPQPGRDPRLPHGRCAPRPSGIRDSSPRPDRK